MHALVAFDLPSCIVKVGTTAPAPTRQPSFRKPIYDLVRFPTACTPHKGDSGHVKTDIVVAVWRTINFGVPHTEVLVSDPEVQVAPCESFRHPRQAFDSHPPPPPPPHPLPLRGMDERSELSCGIQGQSYCAI